MHRSLDAIRLRWILSMLLAGIMLVACAGPSSGGSTPPEDDPPEILRTITATAVVDLPVPDPSAISLLGFGTPPVALQSRSASGLSPQAFEETVMVPDDGYSFVYALGNDEDLVGAAFGAHAEGDSVLVNTSTTAIALVVGLPIKWEAIADLNSLPTDIASSPGFANLLGLVEDRITAGKDLLNEADTALHSAVLDVSHSVLDTYQTAIDNLLASTNGEDAVVVITDQGELVVQNGRWIPYGIARMTPGTANPGSTNTLTHTPFWVSGKSWSGVAIDVVTGSGYEPVEQPITLLEETTHVCAMRSPLNEFWLGFNLASEELTYADLLRGIENSSRTPDEKLVAYAELRGIIALNIELVLTALGFIPDAGMFEFGGSMLADYANDPTKWEEGKVYWEKRASFGEELSLVLLEDYAGFLEWQTAAHQSIASTMFERSDGAGAGYAYQALERLNVKARFIKFAGALIEAPGILDAIVTIWDAYVGAGSGDCFEVMATGGSYTINRITTGGPRIASLEMDPIPAQVNEPFTFTWTLEGDQPPFRCNLNVLNSEIDSGLLDPCGTSFTTTFTQVGTYTAAFAVVDNEDRLATSKLFMPIGESTTTNQPPTISSFEVTPTSAQVGESVIFAWSITDRNGDTMTCELNLGNGTTELINPCPEGADSFTYSGYGSADTYTAELHVSDGANTTIETTTVTIEDAAPSDATINGYTIADHENGVVEVSVSALAGSGDVLSSGQITDVSVTNVSQGTASAEVCGDITSAGPFAADLVLDASGSLDQTDPYEERNGAAKQFVSRMRDTDLAAVASFESSLTRRQELTSDKSLLESAIDAATFADGGTDIWGAVTASADYLGQSPRSNRVMLLFTDGRDSDAGLQTAISDANQAGVRVYPVGLGDSASLDFAQLQDLARGTGGVFAAVANATDLTSAFNNIYNASSGAGCIQVDFDPYATNASTVQADLDITFTLNFRVESEPFSIDYAVVIPEPSAPTALLSDDFNDGDYTSSPAWTIELNDPEIPGTVTASEGFAHFVRTGAGGNGGWTGLGIHVDLPVTDSTTVAFDAIANYRSVGDGCGWACGEFPASVELLLENGAGTEYRLRYSVNYGTAVADRHEGTFKQFATSISQGVWERDLQYTIRDAWPDAVTITEVQIFGNGWDFDGGIDNIVIRD